jgi:DNA repair exonuclease SbcCD ATPase subunit
MNKQRRNAINEIYERIAELRDMLEQIKDEEDDYRDNMPENLQCSERYQISEDASDNLDSALDTLDDALDYIESAAE